MRYLLTVIAVLALASPAMSFCYTPDDGVHADSDARMPEPLEITKIDCDMVDWSWDFYRTDKETGFLEIHFDIAGTNWEGQDCDSRDYATEQTHSDDGSANVTSSTNTLSITKTGLGSGYFENLNLNVSNYR